MKLNGVNQRNRFNEHYKQMKCWFADNKMLVLNEKYCQAWFDQYTDTDLMSVTTDDVPSLYSMTPTPSMSHRSRSLFNREC